MIVHLNYSRQGISLEQATLSLAKIHDCQFDDFHQHVLSSLLEKKSGNAILKIKQVKDLIKII